MNKSTLLALLICLNLVLLTGIVLALCPLPTAYAQGTGLAGNYMIVAAEIQDSYDALYLIDMKERLLHAFYYDRGTRKLEYGGLRNLERDFRNKE